MSSVSMLYTGPLFVRFYLQCTLGMLVNALCSKSIEKSYVFTSRYQLLSSKIRQGHS